MTGRELIASSLRLIGVMAPGETPSASEATDGLVTLNQMIESWSTEGLTIYETTREEFTLSVGTQAYTMGSGGSFDTERPIRVTNATIKDETQSPAVEIPLDILNRDQWVEIQAKGIQSTYPMYLFPQYTHPLAVMNLYPVPSDARKLVLWSDKVLSAIEDLDDDVSFPPGYARALRYGLSIELAPEYGRAVDPAVIGVAMEAKGNIKRSNIKPLYLECDPGVLSRSGSFNYITGESS